MGANAAQTVGATTPFTVIEGEAGTLGGGASVRKLQTIPANAVSSPELEASGRAFVQLTATGQSVSWSIRLTATTRSTYANASPIRLPAAASTPLWICTSTGFCARRFLSRHGKPGYTRATTAMPTA